MQLSICAWTLLTSLHAIISERNNQANVAAPVDVLTTCDRLVPAAKHDLYTGMQAAPWKISAPDRHHTDTCTEILRQNVYIKQWFYLE